MTTLLGALLALIPMLAVTAPEARAATPTLLLSVPGAGEFQPVRGDNFLAWQQNTRRNPDQYDVYARPLADGGRFKVNPDGTNGANGDIDGDVLVYQQFRRGRSNLRFFDLVNQTHSNPPPGVNTPQWEYWPSMEGNWLLFGRLYDNDVRRIFLFDLSTGTARRLDKSRVEGLSLAPGQVSGDYAVWTKCTSATECDVIRYHIPDGTKEQIPNRGGRQHSPSVTPDGTVYFARSRAGCGTGVRLVRRPLEGSAVVLWSLPSGDDIATTRTYVDAQGITTVLFDHFDCGRAAVSDAWQMVEDTSPELSVTVVGSGKVTSSPPGIDCGSDCTESYDSGTGVTLTAQPQGDTAFAGWSGACTGTNLTCTLEMDVSRSVTATFTNKPVLTVTKSGSGQGTVSSTPAGIDCGTDCNQPYDRGTNVTLTADPNQNSTFGGWSGACGGSGLTCNVAMDASKSVTATFILKPLLTAAKAGTGTGTVTSNPPGINCGGDCSERYDTGTSVTLTATPDASSTFGGWSVGTCSGLTCTVTVNQDRTVTATFTLKQHDLQVSTSGTGTGTVMRNPAGTSCGTGCFRYDFGTSVTLTAQPAADSTFESWSGACTGTSSPCNVTMNGDKSVTATFALKPQLTVSKSGDGSGAVSGSGIDCGTDCQERYDPGTEVTLTASPDPLSTFVEWTNCDAVQIDDTCKMTMNGDKSVTATFDDPLILAPTGSTMYEILLAKGV